MPKEGDEVPGSQKGAFEPPFVDSFTPQAPSASSAMHCGRVWGIHGEKKRIILILEDTHLVRNSE